MSDLGLNIVAITSGLFTTKEPTYGYPSSASPFKFAVDHSWSASGLRLSLIQRRS